MLNYNLSLSYLNKILDSYYNFLIMSSSGFYSELQPSTKKGSQLKALFLKNGLLQAKQPCTNICQIFTPVICLIFTYLIQKLASDNLPGGSLFADNTYPYVFGDYTLLDTNSKKLDPNGALTNVPSRDNTLEWYIFNCQPNFCDAGLLGTNDGSASVTAPGASLLQSIVNFPGSVPVNNFTIDYYSKPDAANWQTKYLPFFLPSAYNDVNQDLFKNISSVEKYSFQAIKKGRSGLDSLPDGAIDFKNLSATYLKSVISTNDVRDLDMHRNNGATALRETRKIVDTIASYANGTTDILSAYGFLRIQHYVSQAFTWIQTGKTVQNGWIQMRESGTSASFVDSLINTVAALIFPLALSLLFPVMLYGLVLQKQERLVQMMKMNGMKISTYWFVYAIFNILLAVITNLIFFMIGYAVLSTNFFNKTSPALLFLVAFGWIIAQVGLAAFLQTLLDKARSANIVGYIFAIWTMMIGSTLSIGVYQVPNQFPGWLQAIPPFAFNRLFYLMLIDCSDADCYTTLGEISDEMVNCIISLYVGGAFLFLLGAYLLEILPQEFGVRQHPLFPFKAIWNFVTCKKKTSYSRPERDHQLKKYLSQDEEDPLSIEQRQTIAKMAETQEWPLVINNLRKLYIKQGYAGPYAAVKSFNLRVAKNETFGLLGPNGAGKTTLINMLTGMINPDYGNAWIGGYDINSNISMAQLEMGVCPQFDLLWPQLTVEEHLYFYARLKGIPGENLKDRVNEAIEEVNLTKFKGFLSNALSGGMKRRLSIAISLVGDPKIVFLDEPSTGLDPDNRRQIWQVLVRCQDKRALFLTTHMMEEADALCHRIGIITRGTLRTVGNQLRLKKDYGQGYRLSLSLLSRERKLVSPEIISLQGQNVNFSDERENEAALRKSISEMISQQADGESRVIKNGLKMIAQFVFQQFPGATLNRILGSSVIFKIPITFKISQIFQQMHGVERQLGVTNVSITDSSLQDVFISVVLKYDKVIDDEQTGEMRLITLLNEEDSVQSPVASPPKKVEVEADNKRSSIFGKDRQSVMSEEAMKKKGSDE